MNFEEIDKRAEELFRECGGLPLDWGAVDECVRLHYRKMARLRPSASTDQAPCSQERKSSEPQVQKSASGLRETDTASRRE